jgi:hyperosmotically inducible periplasmic protein
MKQLLLAGLLVCLSLPFVSCTKGRESTTQAAREPRMSDSDLKKKIETQINSDPQLRDANLSVSADADKNRATLSGTVPTEQMRTKAVEMARAGHPGLTVDDKIDVKPEVKTSEVTKSEYTPEMARAERERARTHKETVGNSLEDAWIHSKIIAKLIGDKDTPERKINVDVDHNVVTLRGTVDTALQKEEAERVAKETDGVKRVNNQLKVGKS